MCQFASYNSGREEMTCKFNGDVYVAHSHLTVELYERGKNHPLLGRPVLR